jgi:methionine sulfoxide reductase heme-binding subunit
MASGDGTLSAIVSSKAVWYLTRGTGIVALLLLTTAVVLGILNAVRWSPRAQPRFVLQMVHRNVSLLAVAFISVHIFTAVIDSFAPIRWIDAVVPFTSAYRPVWLGLGAVAFDLVIAVVVTSLLRAQLGHPVWRIVHWTGYALWPIALVHGLGIGSDATQPWMFPVIGASVAAVLAAVAWRVIADEWRGRIVGRVGMAVGAVSMPVVLGVWLIAGPLQSGWAERSGTPKNLLARRTNTGSVDPTSSIPTPIVLPAFASGAGTARLHRRPDGLARMRIALHTNGTQPLDIRVVLDGRPLDQGISITDGAVVLTPPKGAAPYHGSVTGLSGGDLMAQLSDGHGDEIDVDLSLAVSSNGRTTFQVAIRSTGGGA